MKWNDEDIICFCQEITYGTIKAALDRGVDSVEELIDETDAGIACGTCIEDLEELFLEHNQAIERKR